MQSMLEFLLNQERVQNEIQRDSIPGSISCKKKVTFNKSVFVYLIPMVKEFEEIKDLLWYNDRDYLFFKQDFMHSIRMYRIDSSAHSLY